MSRKDLVPKKWATGLGGGGEGVIFIRFVSFAVECHPHL